MSKHFDMAQKGFDGNLGSAASVSRACYNLESCAAVLTAEPFFACSQTCAACSSPVGVEVVVSEECKVLGSACRISWQRNFKACRAVCQHLVTVGGTQKPHGRSLSTRWRRAWLFRTRSGAALQHQFRFLGTSRSSYPQPLSRMY
jgi:hypothetical protein